MVALNLGISLAILGIMTGCALDGKKCIRVGGGWDGKTGEMEYCWDSQKSEKEKAPVLIDTNGESNYILPERDIQDITAMFPTNGEITANNVESPYQKLCCRLKNFRQTKTKDK